jgi:hypothetical protein
MSMFLNSFEFTTEDITTILRAHDTDISIQELVEISDALDYDSIARTALMFDDTELQTQAALSHAEDLMIMDGLWITEPKRFQMP